MYRVCYIDVLIDDLRELSNPRNVEEGRRRTAAGEVSEGGRVGGMRTR